jgi:two-component system, chemotaxis family, CheB/CheR fusion protein
MPKSKSDTPEKQVAPDEQAPAPDSPATTPAPRKRRRAAIKTPETRPSEEAPFAAEEAKGKAKVESGAATDSAHFPIVGVGASAGGLEAYREFLQHLPENIGMAFVLIQHLDPRHESMLASLLQASTKLPLAEARDGMAVEPDHVYVIPPNSSLGIMHGVLHVMERIVEKGKHLPVDYFLESLAEDRGSRAMGVILSGTASDGTLGLRAIKTASGITFAQDEESAEHFGMPGSAIAAGCVDFVLPPRDIARELARIARHPYLIQEQQKEADAGDGANALNRIFMILRNRTGNDFTHYKHSTIRRRITRRMLLHKIESLETYSRFVQKTPGEADALFQDILINVTGFFRDPESFEALKKHVFPAILSGNRARQGQARVWIPGCSTGEEAYSVAMALLEFLGDRAPSVSVQIFATDIDGKAIDHARAGLYPEGIGEQVDAGRLHRFFTKGTRGYQISKAIRDMCVFAVQNVTKDPPFSNIDLVCCRNLMIYLGSILQKKVLQTFHYALQPAGFLMLGTSETIGGNTELFSLLDKKNKIYGKKTIASRPAYDFSTRHELFDETPATPAPSLASNHVLDPQQEAERMILARYAPPRVVITQNLDVLDFRGQTGRYLEPAPGMASLNLLKLARQELTVELRGAIHKAIKDKREVLREQVSYPYNGAERFVDIRVLPLQATSGRDACMVVLFEADRPVPKVESAPAPTKSGLRAKDNGRVLELEHELATTRDYMQSIVEEQEASNEELKSANEEIQSSNEELQSTNEELETAKEELQSTNEELATVNEELENRNQDLSAVNNDLVNLLANVNLPILMLGEDLRIRQFTPQAEKLLNLINTDLGRPISNIKPNVEIPRLDQLAKEVMDTMVMRTLDVQDDQRHWYSMRIRPYKTQANRIEGVVVTFIDVDDGGRLSDRLQKTLEQERRLAHVVRDAPEAITVLNFEGRIQLCNPAAERMYGWSAAELADQPGNRLVPPSLHEELGHLLQRLKRGEMVEPLETRRLRHDGSEFPVWLTATTLRDGAGVPYAAAAIERELHPTSKTSKPRSRRESS